MGTLLADADVDAALNQVVGWTRESSDIVKAFECASFADAIAFVVRIGFLAERADHHPDLDVRWRTVRVALSTHSAGGLTAKDFDLAAQIDAAAGA